MPECYYYYRFNIKGASKSGIKYPLDKCLVTKKLIEDLQALSINTELFYRKFSVEVYHFIRGWNDNYRVISVDNQFLEFVFANLDYRRKISLCFLIIKEKIKIN